MTTNGDITQPLQWSSEFCDAELGLVYYNYRYYNSIDGRWTSRDPLGIFGEYGAYKYLKNIPLWRSDSLGLISAAYSFCVCVRKEAFQWGNESKAPNLFLDIIKTFTVFNDSVARYVTGRKCTFRCYMPSRNNCYSTPCRNRYCPKDHGVEVTVKIFSSSKSKPAALCEDVVADITIGRIDGGARITKDYAGKY